MEKNTFKLRALLPSDSEATHEVVTAWDNHVCMVFSREDGDDLVGQLNDVIASFETA